MKLSEAIRAGLILMTPQHTKADCYRVQSILRYLALKLEYRRMQQLTARER